MLRCRTPSSTLRLRRALRWPAELGQAVAACAALAEAELGQVGPCTCYAGRLRRHCATGPSADSAQSHLIFFIFSEYIQFLANSKICVGFI
jgi:hypothetical protein